MRILVVDDEPLACARLQALLGECTGVDAVTKVNDGEAALQALATTAIDVVLADINMPGLSGLELTRRLRTLPHPPQVIFCTAHEQFGAQAFELGAADYLLKPVTVARLREALERARRLMNAFTPEPVPAITVRSGNSEQRIGLQDVLYLLANEKYVSVFHAGGEALADASLAQLEQRYGDWLIRLHRNCLVPRARLIGLTRERDGSTRARLAGSDFTPVVSRRNLPAVRRLLHGG